MDCPAMIRAASISWKDFLKLVSEVNAMCGEVADADGKHLLFALKKGSTDTFLWRLTMTGEGRMESRKVLTLSQFVEAARAIRPLLDEHRSRASETATDALTASVLMDNVPSYTAAANVSPAGPSTGVTDSDECCCVCMDRRPDVVLQCAHAYCRPCIEQWSEYRKTAGGGFGTDDNECTEQSASVEPGIGLHCPQCMAADQRRDDDWVVVGAPPDSAEVVTYLLSMADGAKSES